MLRVLFIALAVLLILGLGLGAASIQAISEKPIAQPGQTLFFLQRLGEQTRTALATSPREKTNYLIKRLELRMDDVRYLAGSSAEARAVAELNWVLDQLALSAAATPNRDYPTLPLELKRSLQAARIVLSGLTILPVEQPTAHRQLMDKLDAFERLLNAGSLELRDLPRVVGLRVSFDRQTAAPQVIAANGRARTISVPFPKDAPDIFHTRYPLQGKHITVRCETCHANAGNAQPSTECAGCHAALTPADHFPGECGECHNPVNWSSSRFSHPISNDSSLDCTACHETSRPVDHFPGNCATCHSTSSWTGGAFPHTNQETLVCQDCHARSRPDGHYDGECQACHSPTAGQGWKPVRFDHLVAQASDCQSCHADLRPAAHFPGQCSD